MARPKADLPAFAARDRVPRPHPPSRSKWRFGFRFWRQIQNFGLAQEEISWFVSLLDRLRELSDEDEDTLDRDHAKREFYRYHRVNWNQRNIPIARSDLDWLAPEYLSNAEEYPIYQFTISTALGRVAGFHDENGIFQIVLIDPKHNLQPAKSHNYKVDWCSPAGIRHELLLGSLRDARNSADGCSDHCAAKAKLNELDQTFQPRGVVYVADHVLVDAEELLAADKIHSLEALLEDSIINKA